MSTREHDHNGFRFQKPSTRQRQGVTLLEVLVVISVISLLMSLLLPAVQFARERGRQIQCRNNLRQIVLAANEYESQFGVFPHQPVLTQTVSLAYCPTDMVDTPYRLPNYKIDAGSGKSPVVDDGFGVRDPRFLLRARDITDGLSQTVAYSERLSGPPYQGEVGLDLSSFEQDWIRLNYLGIPGSPSFTDVDTFAAACRERGRPPVPMDWAEGPIGLNHVLPPNSMSCLEFIWLAATATSQHPGGVHAAMVDGSVHFVSEHIDLPVWRALGTRAGNEVAQSPF